MATIKPFAAIRPKKGLEQRIAALPYDVYNRQEAREVALKDELSFLNIDRPETQFPEDFDMYSMPVYEKASSMIREMLAAGNFVRENGACYYIYELTMDGRSQTGIVACASVDDYDSAVIKKHENTRADKEADRIRHVDTCSMQTGPIFLAYRSADVINEIVDLKKCEDPLYDFTSDDGITHRVWIIAEKMFIEKIGKCFADMNEIYIADGHHRCASAVRVAKMRREAHPDFTGKEEFNYFLSVLFPDDQLMIMDYNRVLKDLNGHSAEELMKELQKIAAIEPCKDSLIKPSQKGEVTMYLQDKWYLLRFHDFVKSEDPVKSLDVSILQEYVLEPVFGIHDPKTDARIDFVGGIRGLCELERRVHTDCKVAFAMYPTSIRELFAVADAGLLMPPKSTWFEPKLRSGLFLHEIER